MAIVANKWDKNIWPMMLMEDYSKTLAKTELQTKEILLQGYTPAGSHHYNTVSVSCGSHWTCKDSNDVDIEKRDKPQEHTALDR
uniref:Uncharacterized protein n=1 Tax=Octopus bimaculoides TaxID=37653 RepID=A0A0L8HE41_OCTBM